MAVGTRAVGAVGAVGAAGTELDGVARARDVAERVLAPAAAAVDAAGVLPAGHLDALAAAGVLGLTGPRAAGGAAAAPEVVGRALEEVAAADLATAFVLIQHLGAVARTAATAPPALAAAVLPDLCAGRRRCGIALQAALRPGPPAVVARRDGDALVLDGQVPWVTGWGLLDVVLLTAREGDDVHFVLVDAADAPPSLVGDPQPLVAVRASATVVLHLDGHRVGTDRLVQTASHAQLLAGDAAGLRLNGSLALGVALRATRAIGPSPLDAALHAARARLDAVVRDGPADVHAARAAATALAARAATAMAVAAGSRAVVAGSEAERTVREALFLQVFGSRPAIRQHLLEGLGAA